MTFCRCRRDVHGDRCEIIEKCMNKDVDCGQDPTVTCELYQSGDVYCKCSVKNQFFDQSTKVCKECNCGEASESCSLVNGTKICHCIKYFEQRLDQCAPGKRELFFEIFVLLYAVLVNLMEIMDGIDDENTFLLDDELHSDTDTDISSNYLDYSSDDSCKCFCGYHGYCDFDSRGYKTCHCDYGFSVNKGLCVQEISVTVIEKHQDGFLCFSIGIEIRTLRVLFQWFEKMTITWFDFQTVGKVFQ
ncbi:uncharacterized protein NPIL_76041 [Nephila pilipes]|uniref:EGF-like domain-containing protein n=1 Tax=Nephila pilipes TaxID=299642 RepID=A0A8X6MK22_NEPPI|nr:uncharacterized protein NPIL_76041 [Nephila pilipes]